MDQAQEVKQKTDIVAVIGEHVRLTKAGRHFRGLCPFHEERTPSFMVSPELQIYKCFGCGRAGDVYTFLQEFEGLEFYEALKLLADKAGVKLTPRAGQDSSLKTQVLESNELAASFYHFLLTKHKLGQEGRQYLKKRGIKEETINAFQLGFAPPKPNLLVNTLTNKKNQKPEILESAGLVFRARRGYIDRFRGRVIFPIKNNRGETIALAGRILPELDTGKVGKYINSPETPVYHKSASLYGFDVTKDEIRKARAAVVVEGELDLLSAWQSGVVNIVAIKGTAMTEEHVRILSRFADTLVMALDSDFAGDAAAIRGLSHAQNTGLEVKVVKLGKYKDPDDFVRADPGGFKKAVREAADAWEFVIDVVAKRFDLQSGAGKAKASRELIPVMAMIKDNIVRSHYLQKVAIKLGVPVEAVATEVSKRAQPQDKRKEEAATTLQKSRQQMIEEELLALYLGNPEEFKEISELVSTPLASRILKNAKDYIKKNKHVKMANLLAQMPPELRGATADILMRALTEDRDPKKDFEELKTELQELTLKEEISKVIRKISEHEKKGQDKKVRILQERFKDLSQKLREIA